MVFPEVNPKFFPPAGMFYAKNAHILGNGGNRVMKSLGNVLALWQKNASAP
jgi:hypothetical protein